MEEKSALAYSGNTAETAARVIPLLQTVSRVESLVSELALRLDPIVQHAAMKESAQNAPISNSVTTRLNTLGDTLQYLLDNIEL